MGFHYDIYIYIFVYIIIFLSHYLLCALSIAAELILCHSEDCSFYPHVFFGVTQ